MSTTFRHGPAARAWELHAAAVALNRAGRFGADDVAFGATLAASDPDTWGEATVAAAGRLLARYRDDPAGGTAAGGTAAGGTAERVVAAVVGESVEITVEHPRPATIAELAAIPGRRFVGGRNVVPLAAGPAAAAFLSRHGAAVPAGLERPGRDGASVQIGVALEGEEMVVSFPAPPAPGVTARLRAAVAGIGYDPVSATWRAPRSAAGAIGLARFVADTKAVLSGELAEAMRHIDGAALAAVAASRALDAEIDITGFGKDLRPFQRAGLAYLAERRRVLLGDEMGLGKTVTALAGLHHGGHWPAIVVCQASMKLTWAREAGECVPGRKVEVVSGTSPGPIGDGPLGVPAELVIVNYDLLESRLADLAGIGAAALVVDESQAFKSAKAARTKALHALAKQVLAGDGAVYALSGTPALNAPVDLVEQLRLLDRLDDLGGWRHFVLRYCGATKVTHRGRTHWDLSGHTNLIELHERLRATCLIRRTKAEVLSELPPVEVAEVDLDGLDPAAMAAYDQAESDLAAYVTKRARDAGEDEMEALVRAMAAETLVQRTAMRRLLGQAKIPAAGTWIDQFLAGGDEKLVVFAWHREVASALAARAGAPAIVGGMRPDEVEAAKAAFQEDPATRVLVSTIGAGGRGHTLTAATHIAFVEEPWTPAEISQCLARSWGRLSDVHGVTAWHLVAPGTIDTDIIELVAKKAEVIDALTDGREAAVEVGGDDESVSAGVLRRVAARQGRPGGRR